MVPRISVIVPIYNAARYLSRAIGSLQAQTVGDFEIVAVDDGSKDDSRQILEDLARTDTRLRVISRPNTGIVGALNDGLAAARGEFIARMDGDDFALPTRFERQLAYFAAHPECVALGSQVLFVDPDGDALDPMRPPTSHEGIVDLLLEGNGGAIVHPAAMFRTDAVRRVGCYREASKHLEDLDLYLRLSDVGQLANLSEILLHYRQHMGSINHTCGDREALRREIVNPYRKRRGLGDLPPPSQDAESHAAQADWLRDWAYRAARAGNWVTARKNAWGALRKGPVDRRNWQCLKYILTASKTLQPVLP